MPLHHEQELDALKDRLLTMASHAESAVSRAVRAVVERDDELARQIKLDDEIIDQFEIEIDETAIHLLAKAPLASDLRLITVAMKASHDLERVGDEATTIARRAIELNREPAIRPEVDLVKMTELALRQLKDALDSFVGHDPEKAREVIPRDKEIDRMHREAARGLAAMMVSDSGTISRALNFLVIAKSLERVADHGSNIAEEVVYLYEGRDIRHTAKAPEVQEPMFGRPSR